MKISFRTKFQAAFCALTNANFAGFFKGNIYQGNFKKLCVPGLNCYSCPGALFSCPLGSLQNSLTSVGDRFSFYILGTLLGFGVLFGRLICEFMCPFGFLQDLLYKIKLPFFKKRLNMPYHNKLKYLKYVILIVFVILMPLLFVNEFGFSSPYFCKLICPSGTFFASFPLLLVKTSLRDAIGLLFFNKLTLLLVFVFLSIKYYRPFCKYICPLGALYGLFNRVSFFRFEVDDKKCTLCKQCERACPMEIKTYQTPNSADCIRCMKCINACKFDALISTYPLKDMFKNSSKSEKLNK
nr:4Fe-4S binding protein [uncultured Criibacterium sp.]